jgi:ATP-dependent DNA helicase RecG
MVKRMPRRAIDTRIDFLSPLAIVPGLGPRRLGALAEAGLETIGDLLYHLPHRYIDRSIITPIADAPRFVGERRNFIGAVTRTRVERGKRPRFRIQITDESGSIEAVWFEGVAYLRQSVRTGMHALFTGLISKYGRVQIVHPAFEPVRAGKERPDTPFLPIYPLTGRMRECGVNHKQLFKAIQWILKNLRHYPRVLPAPLEAQKEFPPLRECLLTLHAPQSLDSLERFRKRLVYEELYTLGLSLRMSASAFRKPGRPFTAGTLFERVRNRLPFTLTDAQNDALAILHRDAAKPRRMHRLLQGDVGAGKTIVAFCACLPALEHGMQAAWLSPTEALARQTHALISEWLAPHAIPAALLTGSTAPAEKRGIIAGLRDQSVRFVVGTHALLQDAVAFARLGMIVVDEQHKFGARQRLTMQQKDPAADFLLLSATPIPQTLAKTLYGDLDIVSITARPAGRTPVKTHIVPQAKRRDMLGFIADTVTKSAQQAFYVAPRIESDGDAQDVRDAESIHAELHDGIFSGRTVGLLHGRRSAPERTRTMLDFANGAIDVLIATTVIEVGLDVPNATIMVIESPERFGLSQLHQLRGRVGRGAHQSYCFLVIRPDLDERSRKRLSRFCAIDDGFALAEMDLHYRGPGETAGFRQSGWDGCKIADILRDADIYREILAEIDCLMAG